MSVHARARAVPKAGYDVFARGPFAAVQTRQEGGVPAGRRRAAGYRVLFVPKLDQAYDVVVDARQRRGALRGSARAARLRGQRLRELPRRVAGRHAGHQELRADGRVARRLHGPDRHGRGRWPDDVRQQREHVRQLLELPRARRPGPAPGQPDEPVRLPVRDELAAHERRRQCRRPTCWTSNPAATNLFWQHNRIHDEYYDHGFTETAGNFQLNNFDKGGRRRRGPRPRARGRGQRRRSHLHRPRQRVLPRAARRHPFMERHVPVGADQRRLRGPVLGRQLRCVASSSTSTRTACRRATSPAARRSAPSSRARWARAGATGTRSTTSTPPGLQSKAVVGEYVTGNPTRGIRNWDYDDNPLDFGDIGYDLTGPEVHADGEIWTATLWDLRKAARGKYGAAQGRRGRRANRDRRDAAHRARPVVPRRARRHPRGGPRPLPRRRLRHDLDRVRAPRRGRVGDVAGR